MLNHYFLSSRVRNRIARNVLSGDLEALATHLGKRGHSLEVLQLYMQAAEHFGHWLGIRKLPLAAVGKETVAEFLQKHLRHCRCPRPANRHLITNRAALNHLLNVLQAKRGNNIPPTLDVSPIDSHLGIFRSHLEDTCGVAKTTCTQRIRYVRELLDASFGRGPVDARKLTPRRLMEFLAGRVRGCTAGTAQVIASALRSYLRHLQLNGLVDRDLVKAVPIIPRWSLATIPKTMNEDQIERLLLAFNPGTAYGRRGYAMTLCMLDLGLRADEVAELRLEDINWREGTIVITRRKTRTSGVLPLPKRCGRAIARYLRQDRKSVDERRLFIAHRAPWNGLVRPLEIYMAIQHAFERAGLKTELNGAGTRILRQTAATRMHQRGATLKEVADVLGHRSIDTTAIYAKVNLPMLKKVALPWPEVGR